MRNQRVSAYALKKKVISFRKLPKSNEEKISLFFQYFVIQYLMKNQRPWTKEQYRGGENSQNQMIVYLDTVSLQGFCVDIDQTVELTFTSLAFSVVSQSVIKIKTICIKNADTYNWLFSKKSKTSGNTFKKMLLNIMW